MQAQASQSFLERFFKLSEKGTTVRTEVIAGFTTFIALAYIMFVNPNILADAGVPKEAAIASTIWIAALSTLMMGVFANYPVALAPGMGLNAFFAYYVCGVLGLHWTVALGAVFFSGLLFLILTISHVRQAIINAVPQNLRVAIGVGIGLFIAFIGLKGTGLIISDPATFITLGSVTKPETAMSLFGLVLTGVLMARDVQGSILIGIIATTILSMVLGYSPVPASFADVVSTSLPHMGETFGKLDIIGRQEKEEAEFTAWAGAKKARNEKYGDALETIARGVEESGPGMEALTLLSESIGRIEVLGFANAFTREFSRTKSDGVEESEAIAKATDNIAPALFKDYDEALDRKEAEALITFYRDNVRDEDAIKLLGQDVKTMDIPAFVENLFANTAFTSEERIREKVKSVYDLASDPASRIFADLYSGILKYRQHIIDGQGLIQEGSKKYTAGLLEWKKGQPSYPDANSTCRLTYGTVKSYEPKDGVLYKYYTTLKGVMEKEDPDNYEFRVPAKLKQIYENKDYGQYADKNGELVVCFLSNLDITGGNSGSPVMDADGNLIGLAFDGNWEAMSSDVMFEPNLQRVISVDIRYVLLMVDKFAGAGYLLNEMNLVK